jgi:[protein-PII] uridylyltransferase
MDFEQYSPLNFSDAELYLIPLKKKLKAFEAWQVECFLANKEVDKIVILRARFIDEILIRLWAKFKLKESYNLSLIAVGGYGRGELHPKSDIDLLILSDHGFSAESEEKIGQLLLFLWDLKLDIGHSVRSLQDCDIQGRADITVATSMIEARFIEGNKTTFENLIKLVNQADFWPSDRFFILKKQEQQDRHSNCRGDGYNLEPDIKNGSGGLRDIQTIAWIAKRHFKANSLLELTGYGYITQAEYRELVDCQTLLWKLRFALHTVTNRPDNRLLFDFQNDVATLINSQAPLQTLSYQKEVVTPPINQLIEEMMKSYYQTIHHVRELNQMLLQYFDEAILGNCTNTLQNIDDNFHLHNKMIESKNASIFKDSPESILQLFLHVAHNEEIEGISPPTLRALREARRSLTQWLQNIPECRTIFMQIIHHPKGMGKAFSLMHAHGILGAYIPQWSRIVGQMQFDLFHAYTVDQHTHKLVKYIYHYPKTRNIHPLASTLVEEISQPELLFLAAIFHDIAKGQKGDHSTLGAIDARNFCQLHGLNHYDTESVAWLVEHHLVMSITAQRRDISDQVVILKFATLVQNIDRLKLLYCLTVADICATNEDAWNGWKGTLMRELYQSTFKLLRRGFENDPGMKDRI